MSKASRVLGASEDALTNPAYGLAIRGLGFSPPARNHDSYLQSSSSPTLLQPLRRYPKDASLELPRSAHGGFSTFLSESDAELDSHRTTLVVQRPSSSRRARSDSETPSGIYYDPNLVKLESTRSSPTTSVLGSVIVDDSDSTTPSENRYSPPEMRFGATNLQVSRDKHQAKTGSTRKPPKLDLSKLFTRSRPSPRPSDLPSARKLSPSGSPAYNGNELTPQAATYKNSLRPRHLLKRIPSRDSIRSPPAVVFPTRREDDESPKMHIRTPVPGMKHWFDGLEEDESDDKVSEIQGSSEYQQNSQRKKSRDTFLSMSTSSDVSIESQISNEHLEPSTERPLPIITRQSTSSQSASVRSTSTDATAQQMAEASAHSPSLRRPSDSRLPKDERRPSDESQNSVKRRPTDEDRLFVKRKHPSANTLSVERRRSHESTNSTDRRSSMESRSVDGRVSSTDGNLTERRRSSNAHKISRRSKILQNSIDQGQSILSLSETDDDGQDGSSKPRDPDVTSFRTNDIIHESGTLTIVPVGKPETLHKVLPILLKPTITLPHDGEQSRNRRASLVPQDMQQSQQLSHVQSNEIEEHDTKWFSPNSSRSPESRARKTFMKELPIVMSTDESNRDSLGSALSYDRLMAVTFEEAELLNSIRRTRAAMRRQARDVKRKSLRHPLTRHKTAGSRQSIGNATVTTIRSSVHDAEFPGFDIDSDTARLSVVEDHLVRFSAMQEDINRVWEDVQAWRKAGSGSEPQTPYMHEDDTSSGSKSPLTMERPALPRVWKSDGAIPTIALTNSEERPPMPRSVTARNMYKHDTDRRLTGHSYDSDLSSNDVHGDVLAAWNNLGGYRKSGLSSLIGSA